MQEVPLHLAPIIIAAIARMAIGFLWYSPFAFGPAFRRLADSREEELRERLAIAITTDFVASLVMSFILFHAIYYARASTPLQGAAVGLLNWLGFIVVSHLGLVTWSKSPFRQFAITMGCWALSLAVMGTILAAWPQPEFQGVDAPAGSPINTVYVGRFLAV